MNINNVCVTENRFSGIGLNQKTETKNVDCYQNQSEIVSKQGNEMVKNATLPRLKLHRAIDLQDGSQTYRIEGKYRIVDKMSADKVNAEWKKRGYVDSPYKEGQHASIIELTNDTTFVRVYDKKKSGMKGSWVMRLEDIKGKTPEQIANEFALPQIPKFICDVKLPAGTKLRTGECNPLYGHDGGGIQYDLMGARIGIFENERYL